MPSFFDDLESQLRTAASGRTQSRRGRRGNPRRAAARGWLRAGLGALPVLAATGTAVLIAVAALLLLGHRPGQSSLPTPKAGTLQSLLRSTPPARLKRELGYITAAANTVTKSRGCQVRPTLAGSFIRGTPGSGLLSTLGVLRRPQTWADRAASRGFQGTPNVYRRFVRRAFVGGGVSYVIAAARNDPTQWAPPARCLAREIAELHRQLPAMPADLRTPTLALQAGFIAYDRHVAATAPRDTVCVGTMSRNSSSQECGVSATAIKRGIPPNDDQGTFSGVVPDGVATVTLRLRAAHGRTTSVTTPVRGNLFAVRAPAQTVAPGDLNAILATIWRSADGRILKTTVVPRAAAKTCQRHPASCLAMALAYWSGGSSSTSSGTAYAPAKGG